MTHSIYVKRNSTNDEAVSVYCNCGNLFVVSEYVPIPDADPTYSGEVDFGVPLSVLMDIAERHQHDEDSRLF